MTQQPPPAHHIDSLLNTPGNYVVDDGWEPLDRNAAPECECGAPMRLWYQTVYNSDGDYLDSLQLYRCVRWKQCRHHFYVREDSED